jgi:SHS2 domain-containing protein
MELLDNLEVKLRPDEFIYEIISVGDSYWDFFEAPINTSRPTIYKGRLVYRTYRLMKNKMYRTGWRSWKRVESTYIAVSSRGNIRDVDKDYVLDALKRRGSRKPKEVELSTEWKGYSDSMTLHQPWGDL